MTVILQQKEKEKEEKKVKRRKKKKKCRQHGVFPGGHPPQYYLHHHTLDFRERDGYGYFRVCLAVDISFPFHHCSNNHGGNPFFVFYYLSQRLPEALTEKRELREVRIVGRVLKYCVPSHKQEESDETTILVLVLFNYPLSSSHLLDQDASRFSSGEEEGGMVDMKISNVPQFFFFMIIIIQNLIEEKVIKIMGKILIEYNSFDHRNQ